MTITLNEEELAALEFRIEKTSDRQDQPMSLADVARYPRGLESTAWPFHRWDMFFVDVLLVVSALKGSIGVRTEFNGQQTHHGTGSTWLKLARFFIEPNLQSPTQFRLNRQPTVLVPETEMHVSQAADAWFAKQPEYLQQVSWTRSAMLKMREVLVLADKFDAEWWSKFQDNIDQMKGDE